MSRDVVTRLKQETNKALWLQLKQAIKNPDPEFFRSVIKEWEVELGRYAADNKSFPNSVRS